MDGRRGTIGASQIPDVDTIKTAGIITSEQRASVRLSREEKRSIFFINKALEALQLQEREDIFKALGINPEDLQPITEADFKKLV